VKIVVVGICLFDLEWAAPVTVTGLREGWEVRIKLKEENSHDKWGRGGQG
jgi:hypothetical protein